jgi:NADH-quinone oxidoreductase subunit E
MFHTEPVGRHSVEVCTNVSCAVSGAQQVLEALERELGIGVGETSEDGNVTLRAVECLGGCGWANRRRRGQPTHLHVRTADVPRIVKELGE